MRQSHLSVRVLQKIAEGSLKYTRRAPRESSRVLSQRVAAPTGLHADQSYFLVLQERMKNTNRVAPPADTRKNTIRKPPFLFQNLPPRLNPDHTMKIAHHHRIRVRSQRGAKQIVSGLDVSNPIAHGF